MRRTNPFSRFFTKNLYPEEGIGDAFWGYHVANNISRLLNVDATLYFPSLEEIHAPRRGYIPLGDLKLSGAPIVQFTAAQDYSYITGATVILAKEDRSFGTLLWSMEADDQSFYLATSINEGEIGALKAGDSYYGAFGDECVNFEVVSAYPLYNSSSDSYSWICQCNFTGIGLWYNGRGLFDSPITSHPIGDKLYYVPQEGWEATTFTYTIHRHIYNPNWVEGIVQDNLLQIDWFSKAPGTLYVRIFGV